MIDSERIRRIAECCARLSELAANLASLTSPSEENPATLLECYRALYPDWERPEHTRVLLFVYLYLYDPASLTGMRMRNNTRKDLARALGVRTPQTISVRARNLLFCYRTFPNFRRRVDELYATFIKNCDIK